MHNVGVAFEVLEDGKNAPQGWMKASSHIIWDLKMDFHEEGKVGPGWSQASYA
jgi:hypothetical protein